MKNNQKCKFCDEICGKETRDYIEEFSPHRLCFIQFEEDSEQIFDADEQKPYISK